MREKLYIAYKYKTAYERDQNNYMTNQWKATVHVGNVFRWEQLILTNDFLPEDMNGFNSVLATIRIPLLKSKALLN